MATLEASLDVRRKKIREQILIAVILIVLYIVFDIMTGGKFLSTTNIRNIISQAVFPCFVGWGMLFIFSTGIIDLSIGANIILASNVGALLVTYFGLGYFGLIVPTILCVIVMEQLVVQCATTLNIPSWVAGLGWLLVFESATNVFLSLLPMLKGTNLIQMNGYRLLGSLPVMVAIWVVGLLVVYLLLGRTNLSFNMQAVGDNPGVAVAMGINRKKVILLSSVVGAVFIGIAAVVNLSYVGVVPPSSGLMSMNTIFQPLATLLLAGSFARIINRSIGVFLGAIIVASLFNVLTILGVPSGTWQDVCLGSLVIICGVLSSFRFKGVVK